MADPTNPAGAGGPPTGGGGGAPLDPGVANVFERMAQALSLANEKAAASEETLRAMAVHAGAVAEEAGKAAGKLKDLVKMSDNIEDNYKRITEYAKKRLNLTQKEASDAKRTHKELKEIADLYEEALDKSKGQTKETKAMQHNLGQVHKLMKSLKTEGEL